MKLTNILMPLDISVCIKRLIVLWCDSLLYFIIIESLVIQANKRLLITTLPFYSTNVPLKISTYV